MKVLVFGANGKTGRLVVDRAITMGHQVTVLVRHSGLSFPASVRVVVGDALKVMDVRLAMDSQETDGEATAKVHVLGKREPGHVLTRTDLAIWLVEQLESKPHMKQAVTVVNS